MLLLGALMLHGRDGVPVDNAQSLAWIHRAAENWYAPAMNELGHAFRDGAHGLDVDPTAAAARYSSAAKTSDAKAKVALGRMYAAGAGVPIKQIEAARLYHKVADGGMPQAGGRPTENYLRYIERDACPRHSRPRAG